MWYVILDIWRYTIYIRLTYVRYIYPWYFDIIYETNICCLDIYICICTDTHMYYTPADVFSLSGSKMLPMRACRLGFPDPLLAAYFSIGCHWEMGNLSNMVMKMGCFSMVNTCYESVVNDVEHLWCFIGKSVIYVYGGPSTSKRLQEGNRFFWGLSWAIYHKNRFIFED